MNRSNGRREPGKRGYPWCVRRGAPASVKQPTVTLLRSAPHAGPPSLLPDHRDLLSVESSLRLHSLFEAIGADALVRYRRLMGDDVRFQTGMDEHSANVEKAAIEQGVEPRDLVDPWAVNWRAAFDKFEISYDRFIRTTDEDHAGHRPRWFAARWRRATSTRALTQAGIARATTSSRPRRSSWTATVRTIPRSSSSGSKRRTGSSRCQVPGAPRAAVPDNPSYCEPEHFRNEVLGWLREGLRDFSISRAGTNWGIPFPGDPDHRIYVWFDALTNYITGAGFPDDMDAFAHWWPADVHIIGKNITRFHCLYWPAMLMSAGIDAAAPGLRPRLHAR